LYVLISAAHVMHPLRFPNSGIRAKGQPIAASPTASRGNDAGRRGGRPLVGQLLATKSSRCLCRGSGGGGVVRVKEG
ncbi:hypothetical protein BHE74_00056544, partial [Ensete ventricosum]